MVSFPNPMNTYLFKIEQLQLEKWKGPSPSSQKALQHHSQGCIFGIRNSEFKAPHSKEEFEGRVLLS